MSDNQHLKAWVSRETKQRFAELARVFRPDAANPAEILASLQRFYFDTALSSGPAALTSLKAFAGSGRILFGSDWPFCNERVVAEEIQAFTAPDFLSTTQLDDIAHGNAQRLLTKLRPIPVGTQVPA